MEAENSGYIVPKRAWQKLKASMQAKHLVYLYGAAIHGKTELIRQFFAKKESILNGGKDFSALTVHDRAFVKEKGAMIEKILGKYGKGLMDAALAESLYEKGGDTYEITAPNDVKAKCVVTVTE